MKLYKFLAILMLLMPCAAVADNTYVSPENKIPSHPRLLLLKGEENNLRKLISKDYYWDTINKEIINEARNIVDLPLNERIKTGKRLLVASENLRRIFILSYAYRMTRENVFLKRAEDEMLKAASFSDWNPSHFLDVAEMTMAMAIGYDWLFNKLPPESRKTISTAILEKGINASKNSKYNSFLTNSGNWNQVCNSGIAFGALAIWENDPSMSSEIVNRSINSVSRLLNNYYAPDGAYSEGPGYWSYGTSYNVMLISALEKAFKNDFGMSDKPGFLKSGEFILQSTTPMLNSFNYSDCSNDVQILPAMFWFYQHTKNTSILYNQAEIVKRKGAGGIVKDRMAPACLIWGASAPLSNIDKPDKIYWKGTGINPVCMMRSSWSDSLAIYVGVKFGTPSANHGHMDVGSFILEANGISWGEDLGIEEYNSLETKGVDLWNMKQDSQRWDVFRYNNFAHNTLTFNHKLQKVKGKAEIIGYSDNEDNMYIISDLTPVYEGQVKNVKRAVSLINKEYVVVEDKIETSEHFTMVTWTLATPARATVISDKVMLLEKDGKKLYIKVSAPVPIRWHISPAVSPFSFNSPNPGVSIVGFDADLKLSSVQDITVCLIPEENKDVRYESVIE